MENQAPDRNIMGHEMRFNKPLATSSLDQAGLSFRILEVAGIHGGRVQKDTTLADFPLDLGGEWVHTTNRVLNRLSQTRDAAQRAVEWLPVTCHIWDGEKRYQQNQYALQCRGEHRFKSTTWLDFFNDYMAQPIQDRISLNTRVTMIDYSKDIIQIVTGQGEQVMSRHVIVTVPLNVLKDGDIPFLPDFPRKKQRALKGAIMPDGFKLFMRLK